MEAAHWTDIGRRMSDPNFFRLWWTVRPLVIGGRQDHDAPYLKRWFVIPRNKWFNIYVHKFEASDDDRALHDHPWFWLSVALRGGYWEVRDDGTVKWRRPGSVAFRHPLGAHRVELDRESYYPPYEQGYRWREKPAWTLFITGPRLRTWGFYCPQGWIPWQKFTDPKAGGCGEL